MKKFIVLIPLLFSLNSQATVLLSEPFSYPDGSLLGNGTWANTSSANGFNGPILVTNGQARINVTAQEDDNVPIPGSPYDTTNNPSVYAMYASFSLNCQTLPTTGLSGTTGNYFVHFKDNTSSGFWCRLFAQTNNAAAGMFRLGIGGTNSIPASGASPGAASNGYMQLTNDLATNTAYTVVLRLNLYDGTSTLWVNPTAEGDASASSPGNGTGAPVYAFAFRECSSSGTQLPGLFYVDNLKIGTAFTDVAGNNTPPTITTIPNQSTPANTSVGPISFQVSDAQTAATSLVITTNSSNTDLVPNANIAVGGSGTNRTLTITPAAGKQGSTTITVTVTDTDGNPTSTAFTLTVGAPSISTVADQIIPQGTTSLQVSFVVSDHESSASSLTVTGTSSNTNLVASPISPAAFGGSGSNRTVTLTPVSTSNTGVSTITLSVSDGTNTTSTSFAFTVSPQYGILFADSFDYPDGPLYNGSTPWGHSSGTISELGATNGMAWVNQALTEDIYATLTNSPFFTSNGVIVYVGFKLQVTNLPSLSGDYFLHLKDTSSTFRAKLFASTTNAAAGSFRLGISNGANSPPNVQVAQDLNTNSTYNVVLRYNVGTATTTLWLNPSAETDPSVTAADFQPASEIDQIALRQTTGEGLELIDNLVVSTSFNDVLPSVSPRLTASIVGSNLQISWPTNKADAFALQTAANVGSTNWTTAPQTPSVSGTQYVVTVPKTAPAAFYRLKH